MRYVSFQYTNVILPTFADIPVAIIKRDILDILCSGGN